MAVYQGACHCGAISFHFETALPPDSWPLRVCQCVYCRTLRARPTAAPFGKVRFKLLNPAQLQRYQRGLQTTDFLLCPDCGVYIGSVQSEVTGSHAVLNLNTLDIQAKRADLPEPALLETTLAHFLTQWTPVVSLV